MKILLANPSYKQDINEKYERYYIRSGSRWPHSGVKRKRTIPHYLPFPFFLAYAASLLKEANFDVYVVDAIALDLSEASLLERIYKIKPHIVFYEVVTPTFGYDLILANKIKNITDSTVVIGGAHASFFAPQILKDNESIDFVLKGGYEWALSALSKSIKEGKNNFPSGTVFRNGKRIIDTGYPLPIDSLDKLPFPFREIFPSNDSADPTIYWDGFCQCRPAIQMQSSRGCSYNCYFCLWNQTIYHEGKYRAFSTQRVVNEMQEVISRYRVKEIYFDDDDFTVDKEHILSLCEAILRRNLKIKWSCMGNVANLNKDVIKFMVKSGCIGIKFGVESGSERILKSIGKPINMKKVVEIIKCCSSYAIKTHAAFTIGLLGETKQDIEKTIRFAKTLSVDSIQMSIATPYPGTEFFRMVNEKGLLKDIPWQKYDGKISGVFQLHHLNRVKIEKIRKKVFIIWFLKRLLSPLWCLKHSRILLRALNGLGITFFSKQLVKVIIDEWKNRE